MSSAFRCSPVPVDLHKFWRNFDLQWASLLPRGTSRESRVLDQNAMRLLRVLGLQEPQNFTLDERMKGQALRRQTSC